jgi:MFS family permease
MSVQCSFTGKHKRCTLVITTLGWVFDAYDIVLFSLLSIYILPSLEINESTYSIIFGIQLATTAIGGVFFGLLADKIGKRNALIIDFVVYACGAVLMFLSNNWMHLLFARFVAGLAIGGEWGISSALLNDVLGYEKRGIGFGILQAGWSIGVGTAALSAIFIGERFGWRYAFLPGLLAIILAIYVYFNVPEIKPKMHRIRDALKTVPVKATSIALLVAILGMYAFYIVWTWLPRELVNTGILAPDELFKFIGLSAIAGGSGHILFGYMSDRHGRKRIFTLYAAIFIASLMLIIFVREHTLVLFSLLTLQFACGFFAGYGPAFTEIFSDEIRTTGTAFVYNTGRGVSGLLITSNIMGIMSAVLNVDILTTTALAIPVMVLTAVLYAYL